MKRRGLSWRTKLAVLLMLFSVLPVAVLAYWVLTTLEENHRRSMLSSLEGLATAKAAAINQLTDTRTRDVERIAGLLAPRVVAALEAEARLHEPEAPPPEPLPQLVDAEQLQAPADPTADDPSAQPPTPPPPEPAPPISARHAEHERELADALGAVRRALGLILWDQGDFEELLVIDLSGRVIASTFAEHQGRTASSIDYFQSGRRATYVQPVFLSPITQRLTMVISTPIRDADAQEIGVLAARLNLQGLFALINDTSGLGETGETVVGKTIDDEVVFMAPTRHDAEAALNRRYSVRESPNALAQAISGHAGADVVGDYRGQRVLAAWRPVRALGWGLVVKIDETEAMAAAEQVRSRTIQISLAILVLAMLSSMFVARELVRPLRQLIDATDRISRGDLGVRLAIQSGDEIGELADSFERMVAAIKFFREHARREDEEPLELEEGAESARSSPAPEAPDTDQV